MTKSLVCFSAIFLGTLSTVSAKVDWFTGSLEEARKAAHAQEKSLMVFFWWDGSEYARRSLEHLDNQEISKRLENFVCFNADHSQPGMGDLFEQYNVKIAPSILYLEPDGRGIDFVGGFLDKQELYRDIDRIIARGEGTIPGMRAKLASLKTGSDEDLELRLKLAGKLQDVLDIAGHDEMYFSLAESDPKGRTIEGCRAHLASLRRGLQSPDSEGEKEEGSEGDMGEEEGEHHEAMDFDLAGHYEFAKVAESEEGRGEVWSTVALLELQRHDSTKAVKAIKMAEKFVPESNIARWRLNMARNLCDYERILGKKEKGVALKLAQLALESDEPAADGDGMGDGDGDGDKGSLVSLKWNTMSWALSINGKNKAAVDAAKKAIELHPSDENQARLASLTKKTKS